MHDSSANDEPERHLLTPLRRWRDATSSDGDGLCKLCAAVIKAIEIADAGQFAALEFSQHLAPNTRRSPSRATPAIICTMSTASDVNISLEPHLAETLEPLVSILPDNLCTELSAVLGAASPSSRSPPATTPPPSPRNAAYSRPLIRHSLLSAISTWTRTAEGRAALAAHEPPLEPNSYAMVALLAGTRTSPEKKFPDVPVTIPGADARKELNDRRAVTAVLNALLSIFGAGAATWWAAGRLGWRDEWVSGFQSTCYSDPCRCGFPEPATRRVLTSRRNLESFVGPCRCDRGRLF